LFVGAAGVAHDVLLRNRPPGVAPFAVMAGMALFAYGLMSLSFWSEVKRARALLREGLGISDADVVES
jgi:hypothetical protein